MLLESHLGGELYIPKIPSYRILDLVTAIIGDEGRHHVVGVFNGEKLHEEMITSSDLISTIATKDKYVITTPVRGEDIEQANSRTFAHHKGVSKGVKAYSSDTNTEWLSVSDLRQLIDNEYDEQFHSN